MAERKELAELQQYLQQQLEETRRMQAIEQQNQHQQFILQQHQQQLQHQLQQQQQQHLHSYQRQASSPSGDSNDEWVFLPGDRVDYINEQQL